MPFVSLTWLSRNFSPISRLDQENRCYLESEGLWELFLRIAAFTVRKLKAWLGRPEDAERGRLSRGLEPAHPDSSLFHYVAANDGCPSLYSTEQQTRPSLPQACTMFLVDDAVSQMPFKQVWDVLCVRWQNIFVLMPKCPPPFLWESRVPDHSALTPGLEMRMWLC